MDFTRAIDISAKRIKNHLLHGTKLPVSMGL
jgi:hypothetical protein